jgi:hypothetical protein
VLPQEEAFPENALKLSVTFATHTTWSQRNMKKLAGGVSAICALAFAAIRFDHLQVASNTQSAFGFAMRRGADELF